MKKYIIILVSVFITALNINAYGELSDKKMAEAREIALSTDDITLDEEPNLYYGLNLFQLVYFAEILLVAEVGRRNLLT